MERDYAKINFYREFDRKNTVDNEIATFVKNEGEASGFYELCATFLDIALDAPKFKDGATFIGEKDCEVAVASTVEYINNHNITNVEGLIDLIHEHYSRAVRKGEKRPLSGTVMQYDSKGCGGIGTLYNFSKIPANLWGNIRGYILQEID